MAVKLNENDLRFILDQIKIAEAHAAGADLNDLVPDPHVPWGLRTVDGTYNNLVDGREQWGAADTVMPRYLDGSFVTDTNSGAFFGVTNNNYAAPGSVVDTDPRIISNLIVDMSVDNPAAVLAFLNNELAVETFKELHGGLEPVAPGTVVNSATQLAVTDADLALIPNIAPDEGISAPFNGWTTFFGQFFDHGLDLITKGTNGTVYIPLQPDDPLYVPGGFTNFMVLTRAAKAEHLPGEDGVLGTADDIVSHTNTTTPFVDQNQTYTSHASHQVFLREYKFNADGEPVSTGRLLDGLEGGLATWGQIKAEAAAKLGIALDDQDALNIPLLRTDPYGEFIRGDNGLPMIVTGLGPDGIPNTADDIVVQGNLTTPVNTMAIGAIRIGHAFLDDIAHNAAPVINGGVLQPDADVLTGNTVASQQGQNTEYDNELLDRHYITGDGRGNENIALTAVHHVFHSEHNRLVDATRMEVLKSGDLAFINEWLATDIATLEGIPADGLPLLNFANTLDWDGERVFQAARFGTEMQYQHLVFEEFARKIQPAIDPFVFNSSTDIDPSIFSEFANVVYRFGHSMLTETVARTNIHDGSADNIGLIQAFLNPVEFTKNSTVSADEATASIVLGMTSEHGNAIDEFITSALRNNLLGLPLDLAAINIARGRDTGMPTLNETREQLYQATGSSFLKPYDSWVDFAANLKNPMSVVNFIAAYGTHETIVAAGNNLQERRNAAMALVFNTEGAPADRLAFLNSTGGETAESVGLNDIDLWVGGLAEQILLFGGMLGSTFAAIFEAQLEALQDGDRFYYLSRTQGLNLLNELENNAFSKLIIANTDLSDPGPDGIRGTGDDVIARHIGVDAFGQYDYVLEVNKSNQLIEDPTGVDPVLEALGLGKVIRDDPRTPQDESAVSGYVASINALVKQYDASGTPTGILIDGSENVIPGITVGDLRENAEHLGIILTDEDLANAPVLKLNPDGTLRFNPTPGATTTASVLNNDFEATSLADGAPGVTTDANGNYTVGAPVGWEINGGSGGLFDPAAIITDQAGPSGNNVVWLRQGATLARNTGESAVAGAVYTLSFDIGDRTDHPWPGGQVRISATDGANTTLLAFQLLPEPSNGMWSNVSISTSAIPTNLAGQELRIEIQQDGNGGANQILVDTISFSSTTEVFYSSDLTPAQMGVAYDPAADPFARDADGNVLRTGQAIVDGPATNETVIDPVGLAQAYTPGSYLRFTGGEHVVLGGTSGNDTLIGSFGDDGIWGDAGDDFIQGGQGVDLILGGSGDDVILDDGDSGNFIKGEDGDDVIANSAGPFDILMGGRGKDVIFVGPDDTEVFGGEGDDFIAGGEGVDFLLGNEGDDWIEGGGGFDTTAGDNSDLFFDSKILGHDVMFAGNDEHDFDAESGDDIMVQGESVMRNEGMFGFDWATFQGNSLDAYADMRIKIFTTEQQDILRNRFDKVEALSGWNGNDQLFGDDRENPINAEEGVGGDTVAANENILFHDGLSQAGVDRIRNLREFLDVLIADRPQLSAEELEEIIAFEDGNILMGGRGNDRIQGNGGNDIISGDHWLHVRISISDPDSGGEIATVTTLRHVFDGISGPAEWAGKSLFELLVERTVKPAQMEIVREILFDADDAATSFDTAIFQGNISEYIIEGAGVGGQNFSDQNGDGFIEVRHLDPLVADGVTLGIDGVDYLKGIERLEFADGVIDAAAGLDEVPVGTPTLQVLVDTDGNAIFQAGLPLRIATNPDGSLAGVTDPDNPNGGVITDFTVTWQLEAAPGTGVFVDAQIGGLTFIPNGNPVTGIDGERVRAVIRFTDANGVRETVVSAASAPLSPATDLTDINGDLVFVGTHSIDMTMAGNPSFGTAFVSQNGQDTITGGAGDDTIQGLSGNDTLNGGAGDDDLLGHGGDDILVGGAGSDIINGGAGNDTAVLDFTVADATFFLTPSGSLEIAAGADEDELIDIEQVEFSDGQILTTRQAENRIANFQRGNGQDNIINGDLDGVVADDTIRGLNGNDTISGGDGRDLLLGDGGSDTLNGDEDDDILAGGRGNDTVNGGAGDDTVFWFTGDGRDSVNGGGGTDTLSINGDEGVAETFRIYTRAAAIAANINPGGPNNEIVITRTVDGAPDSNADRIALVRNIEELEINTRPIGGATVARGDTVQIFGDFTTTSLALNTITIDGASGDDTVDITALQSAHRIVFKSNGGNDTIIGTLRPQDVIELAPGATLADYQTTSMNGMTKMTFGGHSIAFPSTSHPTFADNSSSQGGSGGGGESAPGGSFALTARDLAGLKNLVNGHQAFEDDDDTAGAGGVRELLGRNNNESHPEYGAADEVFIRLTEARYGEYDGTTNNRAINPIFAGLDARTISNVLGHQEADLSPAASGANTFFMAFGQYFDHGLDFLPKNSANGVLAIGGPGTSRAPGVDNPADLTRGEVYTIDENGVPQHLNKASPFVDQNQAYGSNALVGQFLRESDGDQGVGMRLLSGATDPSTPDFNLLPTLRELIAHHWENDTIFVDPSLPGGSVSFRDYFTDYPISDNATGSIFDEATGAYDPDVVASMVSNFMGGGYPLLLDTNPYINLLDHYVAGDGRANENFALTSMHTIWARNHNFHVEMLLEAGFEGTEEEVFQAAKMINEAEYQRVVFTEFADMLIGGIRGEGDHGFNDYNPNADARISHEFASAVYRVGHSLVGQTMTVIGPDGQPRQVELFDAFLNPTSELGAFKPGLPDGYVPQPGYAQLGAGAILAGVATQSAEEVDFNIVDAIRNDLVRINADLFAFNVARGWDVGLGTLNQVRADLKASGDPYIQEAVGFAGNLDPYASWADFQARNGLSDTIMDQMKVAYPDLILSTPEEIAAFIAVNPDIELTDGANGTKIVKGIDRVDLWVGGLAEKHVLGGMVGQTFWVVLHEQFDRLQEGDRFYYLERFDNFDFYDNFIDGQEFSDIIARNTGLTGLPEEIFRANDENDDTADNDDGVGDDTSDEDGDSDTVGEDNNDDTVVDDDDALAPVPPVVSGLAVTGTAAADVMMGGAEADVLSGGDGDDIILGGFGDDTLMGGSGSDLIKGDAGRDMIFGGAGDDVVLGGADNDMIFGDAGDDRMFGDDGDDMLEGGGGFDTVYGGAGNDRFIARQGDGDDIYWGDAGNDTLDYAAITANLTIDLGNGTMQHGSVHSSQSGHDAIFGFENVIGGAGNDEITASSVVNVMDGGGGNDTFVFRTAADADGDRINGFASGDKIDLSGMNGSEGFTLETTVLTGAGQVLVTHLTGDDGEALTRIQGTVSDGAEADFTLEVAGRHLTQSDFIGVA
ncbi:putative hemolysin-type calcium-binding peroxidase protein [Aurantimonas manganoxydans SI85-9A1]|uniref:Putative hemolysin-type calcium-binding peroxidase protein n=1 Tax=Aurantimonas manganoxydans (strain ATCC BAA-1229 / DSM 21871 / SI85-9A1) TaxID=287752 RepID=Q1YMS2_AURMS|nr:peroxidase family protein [Aurantimonas manganoxydans]EAS51309.1 putative hemolysin-type calcium-binding peroxidase protein [Aurantimonas manganoxydans SI85-9A1]